MRIFRNGHLSSRVEFVMRRLTQNCYLDNVHDYRKSVFLCGSARSGTTWLKDLVNYANEYRILSEPFNCVNVRICRQFAPRQYIRPEDSDQRYLGPANAIFTGRVRDAWIDKTNRRTFVQRRLIKDVRSNLMLKWIRMHFPGMPIIFIVRHPCAVAVSKVKLGWGIDLEKAYLSQDKLVADFLGPFVKEIKSAKSDFQKHVIAWCIETLVPFGQLNKGDVHLIFYENLCASPEAELKKLFAFLQKSFHESLLAFVNKPSGMVRTRGVLSPILSGGNLVDDWRNHISMDEFAESKMLLARFGLDRIYDDGSYPNLQGAESLLGKVPENV
jgi:Sulfotransferase family